MKEIDDKDNPGQKKLQEEDDWNPVEHAQFDVDIRAKNQILFWLSNEIYNAIDSNLTAHDLWHAFERSMQGADVGTQTQQTLDLWKHLSFKKFPKENLEN